MGNSRGARKLAQTPHVKKKKKEHACTEACAQWSSQRFSVSVSWIQVPIYMTVTSVVSYLFIGLVSCSVNLKINHDICKLIKHLNYKKKNRPVASNLIIYGYFKKEFVLN